MYNDIQQGNSINYFNSYTINKLNKELEEISNMEIWRVGKTVRSLRHFKKD